MTHSIDYKNREAWLEARRNGIGASDTPGILGVSQWASPFSVAASKLSPDYAVEYSEAMEEVY